MAMAAGVVVRTVVLRLRPHEGDGGNGEGGDAQRGVNWGEGGGEGGGGVRWWRWWQRHLARQKHMGGDGGGGGEEGGQWVAAMWR